MLAYYFYVNLSAVTRRVKKIFDDSSYIPH